MASPLTIKQPGTASHVQQYVLGALLFAPLFYLQYLKRNGGLIHFNAPSVNLLVHAGLVLLPLSVAYAMVYKPFEYRESEEIILEPQTFWTTRSHNWWMLFLLWTAPLLAAAALLYEVPHLLVNAALWSTGPGTAFLTMLLSFAFGFIYGTILRGRNQVRLSEEGLRNGIANFFEWQNVDHISIEGNVYGIYHRANPALPMNYFKLQEAENRRLLEEYLERHGVRQTRGPEPQLALIKISVAAAASVIVSVGFFLYLTTAIDLRWLLIGTAAASVYATTLLEQVRGCAKVTTTKPLVEPAVSDPDTEQSFLG